MGTPLSDQQQPQSSETPSPPSLAISWKKPLARFGQWFLVGCFGLSLLFLIQLHHPEASDSSPVDHIACDQGEQLAFHIHAHLSIFLDGQPVVLPATIGIASSGCLYWLHTHAPDGIIHMEAPQAESFVLGNFLDIWKQRFSPLNYPRALDQATGWQVFLAGKSVGGDFRTLPLTAHALITLVYQSPGVQPDRTYNWGDL